jgi:hypothetical protein
LILNARREGSGRRRFVQAGSRAPAGISKEKLPFSFSELLVSENPVFQTFGDSLQVGFALLRECHLIDDEAVAKMGHPVVVVRSDVGYPSGVLSVAGSYNWIKKL